MDRNTISKYHCLCRFARQTRETSNSSPERAAARKISRVPKILGRDSFFSIFHNSYHPWYDVTSYRQLEQSRYFAFFFIAIQFFFEPANNLIIFLQLCNIFSVLLSFPFFHENFFRKSINIANLVFPSSIEKYLNNCIFHYSTGYV